MSGQQAWQQQFTSYAEYAKWYTDYYYGGKTTAKENTNMNDCVTSSAHVTLFGSSAPPPPLPFQDTLQVGASGHELAYGAPPYFLASKCSGHLKRELEMWGWPWRAPLQSWSHIHPGRPC